MCHSLVAKHNLSGTQYCHLLSFLFQLISASAVASLKIRAGPATEPVPGMGGRGRTERVAAGWCVPAPIRAIGKNAPLTNSVLPCVALISDQLPEAHEPSRPVPCQTALIVPWSLLILLLSRFILVRWYPRVARSSSSIGLSLFFRRHVLRYEISYYSVESSVIVRFG